jgi:hypothetical protein
MIVYYDEILNENYPNSLWQIQENNYDTLQWYMDTPKPTKEMLDNLAESTKIKLQKLQCKNDADKLLTETDWVEVPSVSNVLNNPHLTNYNDFMQYRLQLRSLAVNPKSDAVFPEKPEAIWSV